MPGAARAGHRLACWRGSTRPFSGLAGSATPGRRHPALAAAVAPRSHYALSEGQGTQPRPVIPPTHSIFAGIQSSGRAFASARLARLGGRRLRGRFNRCFVLPIRR